MKLAKMFLAAAIVITSTQAFAASVCTLGNNYHTCDGKSIIADPIKTINRTAVLQDLLNRGYKIVSVIGSDGLSAYYTLVKE
ncbi:hypothetical protein ACLSU7_18865 [Bdellovibrio sp. HCB185ZH]|uniref:hypothetical protein n=1 Tax=Bdellovibrio sp. HCB185ZH TaxID=3394235 RepID=UPI0039A7603D